MALPPTPGVGIPGRKSYRGGPPALMVCLQFIDNSREITVDRYSFIDSATLERERKTICNVGAVTLDDMLPHPVRSLLPPTPSVSPRGNTVTQVRLISHVMSILLKTSLNVSLSSISSPSSPTRSAADECLGNRSNVKQQSGLAYAAHLCVLKTSL